MQPNQALADTVLTESGQVRGQRVQDIVSFKAIPYAQAPIGELRWRAPQPVQPWQGIRDATQYGPLCMQIHNPTDNGVGPLPMSEDCLQLNVWTPNTDRQQKLPVMVWIHGGGFINGSGTAALYDGSALARQGVVVVTINYRLGRFGFFAHPALTAHNREPQGNYGLMDQVAALQWVQRNISAFGGDPHLVTIAGESAGASSVLLLMTIKATRNLYQRAIVESAAGQLPMPPLNAAIAKRLHASTKHTAESLGTDFADALGMPNASAAQLRAIPADTLMAKGDPQYSDGQVVMLDGQWVTQDVESAFAAGKQHKKPMLIGFNAFEFPFFTYDKPLRFQGWLKDLHLPVDSLTTAYGDANTFNARIITDVLFTEPARFYADQHARHNVSTFAYQFSALAEAAQKVFKATPHAQERQYVFGTLHTSPWPTTAQDQVIADQVMRYWVNFIRQGNPNSTGLTAWPQHVAGSNRWFEFTNQGVQVTPTPHQAALDVITQMRREPRHR